MELIVGIIVSIYQVIKISQYDKIKNIKKRKTKLSFSFLEEILQSSK